MIGTLGIRALPNNSVGIPKMEDPGDLPTRSLAPSSLSRTLSVIRLSPGAIAVCPCGRHHVSFTKVPGVRFFGKPVLVLLMSDSAPGDTPSAGSKVEVCSTVGIRELIAKIKSRGSTSLAHPSDDCTLDGSSGSIELYGSVELNMNGVVVKSRGLEGKPPDS